MLAARRLITNVLFARCVEEAPKDLSGSSHQQQQYMPTKRAGVMMDVRPLEIAWLSI
jgi:hypothetical protein